MNEAEKVALSRAAGIAARMVFESVEEPLGVVVILITEGEGGTARAAVGFEGDEMLVARIPEILHEVAGAERKAVIASGVPGHSIENG